MIDTEIIVERDMVTGEKRMTTERRKIGIFYLANEMQNQE